MLTDPALIQAIAAGAAVVLGALATAIALMIKTLNDVGVIRRRADETHNKIKHEFTPNHGSSARDSLDRVEKGIAALRGDVNKLFTADRTLRAEGIREHRRLRRQILQLRKETTERKDHDECTSCRQGRSTAGTVLGR